MRVGYVQFKPTFGDKHENIKKIMELVGEGARRKAELLVLPELCNTGYVFRSNEELESLSEEIPEGETSQVLMGIAERFGLYIVAGLCERDGEKYYNSAVLVGPEGYIGKYRKAHLFKDENLLFSKGDTPFRVYETDKAKLGIMICYDWFFPEVTRILALKGAEVICHPSNLILPYCQKAMLGAAVQNRVFIVTANRIGSERGVKFTGMSQIVDPEMRILAVGSVDREEVKVVDVDPKVASSKRINKYNDLWLDRRVDLYGPILEDNI